MTPDTPTPPLCKDCFWCVPEYESAGWFRKKKPVYKSYARCSNPAANLDKQLHVVTGELILGNFIYCTLARLSFEPCGKNGKLFESKP